MKERVFISYPESGNNLCFQVEDESFWFLHRKDCILALIDHFPPEGIFYDIGGGNGFMTRALEDAGYPSLLLEPGSGVSNASARGINKIINASLLEAEIDNASIGAACAFDVLEHIEDDHAFLAEIKRILKPGGRFYCTVPAFSALWSQDDLDAGHHRRYSEKSLRLIFQSLDFEVEYITFFFSWLLIPFFLLRTIPYLMQYRAQSSCVNISKVRRDHRLSPLISGFAGKIHDWELRWIQRRKKIPFGSSLLCVVRVPPKPAL